MKYLKPEIISRLKNIEIRARKVVEGFITGLHNSPYHGFSVEFAEYRPYMPGESIKNIDWRVLGRTNKYFVKEFEEETNLKCHIFLDLSHSMEYGSGQIRKIEYAKTIAAALSYLMIKQRDAVGMILFNELIRSYVQPRSKMTHLQNILVQLEKVEPSKTTAIHSVLLEMVRKIKRRGLIILISDLLDDSEKIMHALKQFKHQGHEVLIFHILDPKEINFDFHKDAEFVDLETGEKIITQPYFIQKNYQEVFGQFQKFYFEECRKHSIDYQMFTTEQSYDESLLFYLQKRKKLG